MLVHEVCRECKLTKKAIEYYTEQGLISPAVTENGYRNFSESDIALLKKIAVLRGLGLAVFEVQKVLGDQEESALLKVLHKKEMEISELQEKQNLIKKLAQDNNWENARVQLETLEQKQSILQSLLSKFPGYYGKYLSLHFASFLNEPITTKEQKEAFQIIISYLDGVNLAIPNDLRDYLDEAMNGISEIVIEITKSRSEAVHNAEQFLADNKDLLEQYLDYRKSDEYKQSPAFSLKELLTQFNNQSGYYDVFVPAMRRLSSSYKQYHDDLLKANDIFAKKYGDNFEV